VGQNMATSVFDVAEYILSKKGPMTAMKLQKLVYYSQAWHLAWTEQPLFNEKIEAWRDGPVIPALYEVHKGQFKLAPGFFLKQLKSKKMGRLSKDAIDVIDRIIDYYGNRDPHWLSQLTHLEDPWKNARDNIGIQDQERSTEEITHKAMFEYYCSL
jgi:uncharacterized phage-associated protein